MSTYSLAFISVADLSSTVTFDSNTGGQFTAGDTITIQPGASVSHLKVSDDDTFFDDDDPSAQVLASDQTLNGTLVPAGTTVEAEYAAIFQDSVGTQYRLLAVTLNGNAFTTYGYVFDGPVPPPGSTLNWVSSQDVTQNVDPYTQMAPACFLAGTAIATPGAARPVETLGPGDLVLTRDDGVQPVRLALCSRIRFGTGPHPHKPVRIATGALGHGLPLRPLCVSPQHRLLVEGPEDRPVLIPAKALTGRPGIRVMLGAREATYVHLIFDRHQVVFSEGAPSESFLPGRMALAALDLDLRREFFALFPDFVQAQPAPQPAHPILPPGRVRRLGLTGRAARSLAF